MAKLRHLQTGHIWHLRESSQLGRHPGCWIVLDAAGTSGRHAQIIYAGGRWLVLDLKSRNGTRLDDEVVGAIAQPLARGQRLTLGRDGGDAFQIVDVDPPEPIAYVKHTPTRIAGEDGVLYLPDGAGSVLIREEAGQWLIQRDEDTPGPAEPDHTVEAGGVVWTLALPSQQTETVESQVVLSPTLVVQHSQDLDDFELGIRSQGGGTVSLGARTYGLMLYVLAQRLLADQAPPESSAAEAGWMTVSEVLDELSRATLSDVERKHINLHVMRFRRVMKNFEPSDSAGPRIERRKGSDRIRLAGPVLIEPLGAP